jgi:glycosyltransferase involved in cell wall biosynthesis
MKVLYDFQTFALQQYGGVSRYFTELITCFDRSGDVQADVGVSHTRNHYLLERRGNESEAIRRTPSIDDFLGGVSFKGKGRLYDLYRKLAGPDDAYASNKAHSRELLKAGRYDVFHPTYYDPYYLDLLGDKPLVVTVYDMIHEIFPEDFSPENTVSLWKRESIQRADQVIAISESTKRDIERFVRVDADKITVVPLASSLSASGQGSPELQLPARFIAYVGNRENYKNFYFLVEALGLADDKRLNVVCFGSYPFREEEKAFFSMRGVLERMHHLPADDATLVEGYRRAIALAYPSLYEGFGIPILEAFACGCPVICSNTGSFPEVAADGAFYFEPKDIASLVLAIDTVAGDESVRSGLASKGRLIASRYSWHKTAEETLKVYHRAMRA